MIAASISSVVLYGVYSLMAFGGRAAKRTANRTGSAEAVSSGLLQIAAKARYTPLITSPGIGRKEPVFEFSDRSEGTWRIQLEGRDLVLSEPHGSERVVLATGLDGLEFQRDTMLDDGMMGITFLIGKGKSAKKYSTVVYTRGTRRPPGR